MPHPKFQQAIDIPAQQSGGEDGLYLNDLADGAVVDIETQHRHYRLVKRADTHVRISGHPTFCPEPVEVEVEGSIGSVPDAYAQSRFYRPRYVLGL